MGSNTLLDSGSEAPEECFLERLCEGEGEEGGRESREEGVGPGGGQCSPESRRSLKCGA